MNQIIPSSLINWSGTNIVSTLRIPILVPVVYIAISTSSRSSIADLLISILVLSFFHKSMVDPNDSSSPPSPRAIPAQSSLEEPRSRRHLGGSIPASMYASTPATSGSSPAGQRVVAHVCMKHEAFMCFLLAYWGIISLSTRNHTRFSSPSCRRTTRCLALGRASSPSWFAQAQ